MIIENIKTGQRFEVAPGTTYPKSAYREVTLGDNKTKKKQAEPKPPVKKAPAKKKKATKKKPSKKTKKINVL